MTYYPITIPTLCRYEHFKRCVHSLSNNTHADKTELIIGLDYPLKEEHQKGYKQILEYIPTIKGFKTVTVFKREKNYGASANNLALREYAFSKYDACIFSEDDNEFSPCFLDFMNQALEKYKDENKIVSICGFLSPKYYNLSKNIVFQKGTSAYGLGIWKHKEILFQSIPYTYWVDMTKEMKRSWKIFLHCPGLYQMLDIMIKRNAQWGDVMRSCHQIENDLYQIAPYKSMVRNWGNDGSGLHCSNDNGTMKTQDILSNKIFKLKEQTINNSIPWHISFFEHLPSGFISKTIELCKLFLRKIF